MEKILKPYSYYDGPVIQSDKTIEEIEKELIEEKERMEKAGDREELQ